MSKSSRLPDQLRWALDQAWHMQPESKRLVRRLELYGVEVAVVRLQLGDPHDPGFGFTREIYRTERRTNA
jgi:hypothetical protein